jgi:hypothetical protein
MNSQSVAGLLGAIVASIVMVVAIAYGPIGQFGKPAKPASFQQPAVLQPVPAAPVVVGIFRAFSSEVGPGPDRAAATDSPTPGRHRIDFAPVFTVRSPRSASSPWHVGRLRIYAGDHE